MVGILKVKNWQEFQHYKNRNPAWIKLHKHLLDDYDFQSLPDASKALAPMLWLMASESNDGLIEYDLEKISFRLRMTEEKISASLKPLLDKGFFLMEQRASKALAGEEQRASPEKRREEEENREEKEDNSASDAKAPGEAPRVFSYPDEYNFFYDAFPNKKDKKKCYEKAWLPKKQKGELPEVSILISQAIAYGKWCEATDTKLCYPQGWINGERWNDDYQISKKKNNHKLDFGGNYEEGIDNLFGEKEKNDE